MLWAMQALKPLERSTWVQDTHYNRGVGGADEDAMVPTLFDHAIPSW